MHGAHVPHARRRRAVLPALAGAVQRPARGAIVLFHRGHEHSGRMAHLVDELDLPDFDFFAWDARGHGRSPGERGFSAEHRAHRCATCRRSSTTSATRTASRSKTSPWSRRASARCWSPRGRTTTRRASAAWCSPRPRSRSSSMCRSRVPGSRLMHKLRGNFFVTSYVKAKFLTHDPARIASYDSDPLIARAISVNILLGLYDAAERIVADARGDHRAHAAAHLRRGLGRASRTAARVLRPAGRDGQGAARAAWLLSRHAGRAATAPRPSRDARAFLLRTCSTAAARVRDAARCRPRAASPRDEADALAAPLPPLVAARALLGAPRAPACASAVCCRTACGSATRRASIPAARSTTSTAMQPTGVTPLGRLIDRNYLESIGWRGIRQRKLHLEELLRDAIAAAARAGRARAHRRHRRRPRPLRARRARRGAGDPIRSCCATTAN